MQEQQLKKKENEEDSEEVEKVVTKENYSREIEAYHCLLGLPDSQIPEVEFTYSVQLNLNDAPAPSFPIGVTWLQFQLLKGLRTGTLVISPFSSEGIAYEEVIVTINLSNTGISQKKQISPRIISFLKHRVINWEFTYW